MLLLASQQIRHQMHLTSTYLSDIETVCLERIYQRHILALLINRHDSNDHVCHDTVQYYLEESRYRDDPSAQIAMAIVVVTIWIYYVTRVLRENRIAKLEESQ